jgi:hypothetical protein
MLKLKGRAIRRLRVMFDDVWTAVVIGPVRQFSGRDPGLNVPAARPLVFVISRFPNAHLVLDLDEYYDPLIGDSIGE